MTTPIIGIPADYTEAGEHRGKYTYIDVVLSLGALPIIIPAIGLKADMMLYLDKIDGLLLQGGKCNVAPIHYGHTQEMENPEDSHERDATTLPLIRGAEERGVPIFGICLGIQHINVALGGTLHQQLDKMGRAGHQTLPEGTRFEGLHKVELTPGGRLQRLLGRNAIMVNSEHNQAINDLAPALTIEATSSDGTIEAVSAKDQSKFVCGVQWHPEYKFAENPVSQALFAAFGAAVHTHANSAKPAI